jgi:hypothetical protein
LVGACSDAVGHDRVGGAAEPVHPLDGDGVRALTLDLRAHLAQALREIDDLGLARGVVDHRGAARQRRGHQRVFRGPDRDHGKRDPAAPQPAGGAGVHVAVAQVELGAHRL